MAVEALCPTCGAVFNLSDDYVGKKVRCKKCEHAFTVGGEKGRQRDDDEGVQSDRAAFSSKRGSREDDEERATRKAAARRDRDEDEGDRPRRSRSRDDDDERGRSRKRNRAYHDDDDEDDRGNLRRQSSGSGKIIAIIAGVAVVVLLVCGGGIFLFVRLMSSAEEALQDQMAQQGLDANGNPIFGANPGPGFAGPEVQPRDMAEALVFLKGNDAGQRRGAANWLARQQVDAGRQKEVAAALEPLVKDLDDATCAAGANGLRVWGARDNGPALTQALRQRLPDNNRPFFSDVQKQLMYALAQSKYEPGADVVAEFLPNFFANANGEPEKALDAYGPTAEKAILKYFNHPSTHPVNARDKARRLLQRYNTKPVAILDQTIEDLRAVDQERGKAAAEWLSRGDSDEALNLCKADPARRTAVATGLNRQIDTPAAFFEDTLMNAVKRFGTKDNVPSLVRFLQQSPFKKREIADALIAIGPECEPQVRALLEHQDRAVVEQAKRVLERVGGADAKFVSAIADLKSDDGRRIEQAARSLQAAAVDEKQRPAVVVALLGTIHDTGVHRADHPFLIEVAKALALWASKDDGAAIVGKVREMHKFFCRESRKILIEWMGKQKVEKAIPFLAEALADKDDSRPASQALQAMGTELGEVIEVEVAKVTTSDRNQTLECITVIGAVGTKKSLDLLKKLQALALKQKDQVVAQACATAAAAINARGK